MIDVLRGINSAGRGQVFSIACPILTVSSQKCGVFPVLTHRSLLLLKAAQVISSGVEAVLAALELGMELRDPLVSC